MRRFKLWLMAQGWWSEPQDEQLQQQDQDEILAALKMAETLPPPPLTTLVTDVYAQIPPHLAQQFEQLIAHIATQPEHYPLSGEQAQAQLAEQERRS